ncbi:MFS transporter [Dactylosporangium sp. NPDC051484]|uniref:MFS transporter n=1 Tax=Dactylosporangium sp. NPDC051484 TaxID=3154942 RepID=UPI00344F7031
MSLGSSGNRKMERRRLWALIATVFIGTTAVNVAKFVTAYRIVGLGMGGDILGAVSAAFALLPLLVIFRIGRLTDRGLSTPIAGVSLGVIAAGLLAMGQSETIPALLVSNAIIGLGHVGVINGTEASIARLGLDRDFSFGIMTASHSLSQMAGPLVGGLLLSLHAGSGLVGASTLALSVCAVAALIAVAPLLAVRIRRQDEPRRVASPKARLWEVVGNARTASTLYLSMITVTYIDVITVYLPLLGRLHGWSPSVVGSLLAARAFASFLARIGTRISVARVGRVRLMMLSVGIPGALTLGLASMNSLLFAFFAMIVSGLFLGFGQPLSISSLVKMTPARMIGYTLSVRLAGNRLALILIPVLAGLAAGAFGATAAFWMLATLLLASAVFVQLFPPAQG